MGNKLIGVFGASGFGREVMPLVREQVKGLTENFVFIDDNPQADSLNGHEVLTYTEFCDHSVKEKLVSVAIAHSSVRQSLTQRCLSDGIEILSVAAPNVVKLDRVKIGAGVILCPFVTITSNVSIGKSFHGNINSYIAHDCVIGDYVTFAPGVKCNGNIRIGDHAYIGTGAIIKQGQPDKPLSIGEGAIVGMGAVVTKDVPAGVTVIGNPARILNR